MKEKKEKQSRKRHNKRSQPLIQRGRVKNRTTICDSQQKCQGLNIHYSAQVFTRGSDVALNTHNSY